MNQEEISKVIGKENIEAFEYVLNIFQEFPEAITITRKILYRDFIDSLNLKKLDALVKDIAKETGVIIPVKF